MIPPRTTVRRPLVALAAGVAAAVLAAGPSGAQPESRPSARRDLNLEARETGSAGSAQPPSGSRPLVYVAEVDAIIHPVSAEYMVATMDRADEADAALVVFILRTPGGLVDSTRTIVSRMIHAEAPVVVYVAPSGARAASAGFLLALAADVAAMAPGTSIGAAHPVSGDGSAVSDTVSKKAASDVAAYARSLAEKRRRNVKLAEQAVLESRAFTDQEARTADPPLIDLVAGSLDELLRELDGRTVVRFDGRTVVVRSRDATIERVEMTWRQRLLSAIAHPQVAYLLFSLGTLGLTIELWNPGSILPGVVGGICLLLAFFAFQILPINWVGLLLILFGIVLLVIEVKVASFGLLATGGIVSLLLGSMMLIDSPLPELQIGLRLILPVVGGVATVLLLLVNLAVQAQRRRPVTGPAGMVGERGRALSPIAPGQPGRVATHGEIWRALSQEAIGEGDAVEVVEVDGLTLRVRRAPGPPEGAM
jgi:membrane-bound serine protease (ClpP class)